MDPESICFLDLELFHINNLFTANNYRKPTAGYSFLHYSSSHHPRWVKYVPKSQFHHLRHNCTRLDDYKLQCTTLKKKFPDKGYPPNFIDEAHSLYQTEYFPTSRKQSSEPVTRYITQYHVSHRKMENVFKKHWSILTQNPHLS